MIDGILCRNNPLVYVDPSGHSWGSFFKSFVSAFVGAVVFVATGGVAAFGVASLLPQFIGSCMAAGAVSGATSAGLNGGNIIQGAVTGGIMGGATGGILGAFPGAGPYLLAAGAGNAYARGGREGLADFGGGVMGAMAGAYSVNSVMKAWEASHRPLYADNSGVPDVQPSSNRLRGNATCYDLTGNDRADGNPFNANERAGAMFRKGTFGKEVDIYRLDGSNQVVSKALDVTINDTGPFLRGTNGRAVIPFQPDPNIVIDVTPRVYQELTGYYDCKTGPGNFPVSIGW